MEGDDEEEEARPRRGRLLHHNKGAAWSTNRKWRDSTVGLKDSGATNRKLELYLFFFFNLGSGGDFSHFLLVEISAP